MSHSKPEAGKNNKVTIQREYIETKVSSYLFPHLQELNRIHGNVQR